MRSLALSLVLVLGAAAVGVVCVGGRADETKALEPEQKSEAAPPNEAAGPARSLVLADPIDPARLRALRWIAAGGGARPELTGVQIEQDLALAAEVLGEGGLVLFGAGAGAAVVQVQRDAPVGDEVVVALAELFAPRGGRDAIYRAPELAVDGPATVDGLTSAIEGAIAPEGEPLVLVIAGHGQMGAAPADNFVELWAEGRLTVRALAALLDDAHRPVRVVATTCFSGGFAELAFARADTRAGASAQPRCGLFASTWDLEAAGCDADPDRARQEGYALHFFQALRGQDRDGATIDRATIDLDGDGAISLLEAHTRVRIASAAADVPTTTSERLLRQLAPTRGRSEPVTLPEEDAVVAALRARLGFEEGAAALELQRSEDRIEAERRALEEAQAREDRAYAAAAADLLARWPVLDDPWHPAFDELLAREREAIAEHLRTSPSYADYLEATASARARETKIADLRAEAAPLERFVRAAETRALAGRLRAKGGRDWDAYARVLACERSVP